MTGKSRRNFVGPALGVAGVSALGVADKVPTQQALAAFDLLRAPDSVDVFLEGNRRESLSRRVGRGSVGFDAPHGAGAQATLSLAGGWRGW